MSHIPHLLITSGKDQSDPVPGYNLKLELRGIRSALESAEQGQLCEVLSETNLNLDRLVELFYQYPNQISLFHLGGTQDDFSALAQAKLSRELPAPQAGIPTFDGDLIQFLGRQKGLHCVFLNGCGDESIARQLTDAGVPMVISSTQGVADAAATDLAIRFYKGLAQGAGLQTAFQEAISQTKSNQGGPDASYQVIEADDKIVERATFPWKHWVRKGSELVKGWNLPVASRHPLLKLPLPQSYVDSLPEEPYLGLQYFERSDAGVFFGRGRQIWELYQRITGPAPIILYYGKSGAGKSSLLDAGLLPRIEAEYTVEYMRRIQAIGLEASLFQALIQQAKTHGLDVSNEVAWFQERKRLGDLNRAVHNSDVRVKLTLKEEVRRWKADSSSHQQLAAIWRNIEQKAGKPLLLILDQVEEAFTRPAPPEAGVQDELQELLAAIQPLFGRADQRPKGKILFSYRKEYHPEIRQACYEWELPVTEVFLQHLDREGIMEVVEGVATSEAAHAKYGLSITAETEGNLAEIIADDLLEDPDSPVAAVLQIVLTKMWKSAIRTNRQAPTFSIQQYQSIKKGSLAMGEFFEKQLEQLRVWQQETNQDVVDSGLVLDVLQFHTTQQGTSGIRKLEELRKTYQHRQDVIDSLVKKCKELYLLTETQNSKEETSLAHDTLAPVVLKTFNESDSPGQRATRILNNKIEDFKKDEKGVYLDEADLSAVEKGLQGMKQLEKKANDLIAWSQIQRAKRQKERKRNRRIFLGMAASLALFGVVAGIFWMSARNARENTIRTQIRASWKAGEFLRTAGEADYEKSRSWLEGVRQMEKFLKPIVDLEKVNSLSPMPVFISGPHEKEFNFNSSEFGYYNPEFVAWARDYAIPASEDATFRELTQPIYDDYLKLIAQTYYYVHLQMDNTVSPERMEEIKTTYLAEIEKNRGQNYQADSGTGPGEYLQYRVPEFGAISDGLFALYNYPDPMEMTGYHAIVATGFWTRREIDGSKEELLLLLEQLLETYDPEFLAYPVFE